MNETPRNPGNVEGENPPKYLHVNPLLRTVQIYVSTTRAPDLYSGDLES